MKTQQGFKKRIKNYLISFCANEYYGKSLHGQMRAGYDEQNKKLYIFRINPLPLSTSMKSFLNLQQTYSKLKDYARTVYEDLNSSSSNYTVLQFFPKTFESEIDNFRKNQKYFDEMVQKFLKTYSFFYNMRISHGNLIPSNIGITFNSTVKLMDFQISPEESSQQSFQKDFQQFKLFVSRVLEKDWNYPYKFDSFNSKQKSRWDHLLNSWHVVSPLEPIYISRKSYVQNIVTGLYKLEASLEQILDRYQDEKGEYQDQEQQQGQQKKKEGSIQSCDTNPFIQSSTQKLTDLRLSIRLLQLNYLLSSQEQKHLRQKQTLQEIIGPLESHDLDYYNSVIVGAIRDYEFYCIDPSRRLFLICCLIPTVNHEYIFDEIVHQFKDNKEDTQRNLLLGDTLFAKYKSVIYNNLLKQK